MKKTWAHTIAVIILLAGIDILPAGEASQSRIVAITDQGVQPVRLVEGRIPKASGKGRFATYFLESEVAVPSPTPAKATKPAQPRAQSTPQPAPVVEKKAPRPAVPAPSAVATPAPKKAGAKASQSNPTPDITIKKHGASKKDDLDEYSNAATIPDPAEPVNRGIFWANDQIYTFVFKPVSKVYETVLPSPVRSAIYNVYDNTEYPVRLVNNLLQLNFKRADLETRKFFINTVGGVGGIIRLSDRFPDLANVPPADTGQTFAKWGIGHGAYAVLPVIGPKSARDTVGMAGDYALNPVSWVSLGGAGTATSLAISAPDTARNMNSRMKAYDATTQNTLDPYIAVRSSYTQYRKKAASQ